MRIQEKPELASTVATTSPTLVLRKSHHVPPVIHHSTAHHIPCKRSRDQLRGGFRTGSGGRPAGRKRVEESDPMWQPKKIMMNGESDAAAGTRALHPLSLAVNLRGDGVSRACARISLAPSPAQFALFRAERPYTPALQVGMKLLRFRRQLRRRVSDRVPHPAGPCK